MAAPIVTVQKLVDTQHRVVFKLTNTSDGTEETKVTKIDLNSDINGYQTNGSLTLTQAQCIIPSGQVYLYWGDTVTDALIGVYEGVNHYTYNGVLSAPISSNATSPDVDNYIKLSTLNFPANSGYTLLLEFKKNGFGGWVNTRWTNMTYNIQMSLKSPTIATE